ncbi:MAG: sulfatase [Planctomycetota bacterium]
MQRFTFIAFLIVVLLSNAEAERPNILIAVSDDQSFPHASAYGAAEIKTPGFDAVAKAGVLFHNAFTPAPGCSPMRAAFLTGREIWQNREAGTHASYFPRDLPVFTEQLEMAGYHVGMTGKGWGPGRNKGWPHNPAGKAYSSIKTKSPPGISATDYAANFDSFLKQREDGKPFCFWFGAHEPHRVFGKGLGKENGIDPSKLSVPKFLPDSQEVRNDLADYFYEIQWFDSHLVRMLDRLRALGELDNTLIVVTSDNGMSFPRAKANCYEYGIHMPLAIAWPDRIPGGQETDDLVSLIDVTRTILAAGEVTPQRSDELFGTNLLPHYGPADKTPPKREAVFSGRERHSSSRFNSLGYPCRCIRTKSHLYIRNFRPERWPAGTPRKFDKAEYDKTGRLTLSMLGANDGGYHDIDACPTLTWMIKNKSRGPVGTLLDAAVALRPAEELYDIRSDPACLNNLAEEPALESTRKELSNRLEDYLRKTGDVRVTSPENGDVWETYPRVSQLRWFPTPMWAKENPDRVPDQEWLEKRRPR